MESRANKRIRQACQNCRRKKTRCSGDRPVCAMCQRLQQECVYDDGQVPNEDLVARLAMIESRLGLSIKLALKTCNYITLSAQGEFVTVSICMAPVCRSLYGSSRFTTLPDLNTIRTVADAYFRLCHNHPYSYFEESDFREKLEERCLPSYLLLTFMAISARYSDDPYFRKQNDLATKRFAAAAWTQISDHIFADDGGADVQTVQATSMLAMNDFLLGKLRSAGVKIGLCVRLAQTLRLNEQSTYDAWPEPARQEAQRTFWSVYLLDKLVSMGRHRPPSILDVDCTVSLPTNFKTLATTQTSLSTISNPTEGGLVPMVDDFALVIFMASVLGRTIRYSLQQISNSSYNPWDSRSEYASIYGALLGFETFSNSRHEAFDFDNDFNATVASRLDSIERGHFVFSHVLYHLNNCLLHHPFLLKHRFKTLKCSIPPTFLREAIGRNKQHAERLVSILKFVLRQNLPVPSFFAFCAVNAGVIVKLHAVASNTYLPGAAASQVQFCLDFLDHAPKQFIHSRRMAVVLRSFKPSSAFADAILSQNFDQNRMEEIQSDGLNELLWNTFDSGWLSDSERPTELTTPPVEPEWDFDPKDWIDLPHDGLDDALGPGHLSSFLI
ncbi:fungal-specific transcription factor domain-containing protein [Paraphoma chrysanthemicola]|uniref:Fungal-specific transcription factor domain-containing protein n=1 Tax=Paraphoma chrysanthemicola TaxID=798071 RepID=A0A8K0QWL7_9PLEO|nr:fungal-specific transcription factor domain-containing protein [Paraphoma chrysanthemicola]